MMILDGKILVPYVQDRGMLILCKVIKVKGYLGSIILNSYIQSICVSLDSSL